MHPGANAICPRQRFCLTRSGTNAFTLVDLLVIMALLVILAIFLQPSMVMGREKSRRAACKDQMRQFLLGVHMYANDNSARLPSGRSDYRDPADEHIPVISKATRDILIQYSGSVRILECPSLPKPFNNTTGWLYPNYGFVLGYNYLGGHQGTPWPVSGNGSSWLSPQTANDNSSLALLTDLNAWSAGYDQAFVPHGNHGPVIKHPDFGRNPQPASARNSGAVGGNLGLLDGSVDWKKFRQMRTHRGSRLWGEEGCFAAW
ncbi:MAG: prepilin-type N-terminal cleavage/methylation domain [Pedosphaera sp.]|nr:prepilin-type N-terminal cleavage/methylation domain [Pedosphaera sp.]